MPARAPLRAAVRGQQPVVFPLDDRIALAGALLQPRAVEHRDAAARVADQPGLLQLERAPR